ncbi:MAG: hypothetical protein FWD23_10135 [Oscillospiraceae bacterium]|nr:hypothetical protein [Oscillospiraceae bacterium]
MGGGNSKSMLPLVEICVSTAIFAIAVILSLQLFLFAKFLGSKTSDVAKAVFEAQSVAENIKTMQTGAEIEDYFQTELHSGEVYYDTKWEKTDSIEKAAYNLVITKETDKYGAAGLYKFKIEIYKTGPYPFIDDKKLEKDPDYIPVLVSVETGKFVLK